MTDENPFGKAIVPMPWTTQRDFKGDVINSLWTQVVCMATLVEWRKDTRASLILLGENTFGPKEKNTAVCMWDYFTDHHRISPFNILCRTDMALNNTAMQLDELQNIIGDANRNRMKPVYNKVTVVTWEIHAARVKQSLKNRNFEGVVMEVVTVEAIIEEYGIRHTQEVSAKELVELLHLAAITPGMEVKEWVLNQLIKVNPQDQVVKMITKIFGPTKLHMSLGRYVNLAASVGTFLNL